MKALNHFSRLLAIILPLTFSLVATSCNDDDDNEPQPPVSEAGQLAIDFEHTVKGQPLTFNTAEYTNAAGNKYQVTLLKYYISNVTLTNSQTGETYKEPNSYHLINATENKNSFTLNDIPLKKYDRLSFAIGVDSAANLSTAQPGDLNPNNDMAWNWNTGYIFMKFEGHNLKTDPNDNHGVLLHIGHNVNYKTLTFDIAEDLTFAKDKPFRARLNVDANALLESPNTIDFNSTFNVMGGPNAAKVADNYSVGMFSLLEVKPE